MRLSIRHALPSVLVLAGAAACSDGGSSSTAPGASSVRWYVDVDAPSGGDGRSWAGADRDLAAVLARAQHGDDVWIAAGTYRPAPPGAARDAAFVLPAGVGVYGGFAGDETELDDRLAGTPATILDGDLNGDDGPDFTQRADNAYQVVVATDAHGARLDALTIRGGYADGPGFGATPDSRDQGSGINVYHGAIEVVRCTLRENWATNHGTVNDHTQGSTFVECLFEDNASAQFGAGLYLHHEAAALALACTFRRNVAGTDGGGAYTRAMHGARFDDCLFVDNAAERGAGLYCAPASAPHVANSTFADNVATVGGGGIYADESDAELQACTFARNEAGTEIDGGGGGGGGSGGGGVWTNGAALVAIDCAFFENRASFGGGFYAIHEARALVTGAVFQRNVANEAGGLYTLNSPTIVLDSSFVENEARDGQFSVGGALSNYYSDSVVDGCTFERNRALLGGGALYNEGEDPIVRRSRFHGNVTDGDEGFGGAILDGYFTRATIEDCTFVGNRAKLGGGTYDLAFSEARIVNCTYVANEALEGGGAYVFNLGTPAFANCVIADCVPDALAGFGAPFAYGLAPTPIAGTGNVIGAPTFLRAPDPGGDGTWGTSDDDAGELALAPGSLGIDAGWNDAHSVGSALDVDGGARFVDDPSTIDTGAGVGALIDMGASERQP